MLLPRISNVEKRQAAAGQDSSSGVTIQMMVDEKIKYFEGHFPNFELLPGVAQLHWAVTYGREYLGVSGRFTGVEVIKFVRPIAPNAEIKLTLEKDSTGKRLSFSYDSENFKHSSGTILFARDSDGV